jgi:type II secretory pathway pseudopilin PulG
MAGAGAASMLMMVAIIGIIAAIAIPSLLRARVSANESATIGNLRTMVSAQEAYAASAGSYGPPECLASPSKQGCIVNYPANGPEFLDQDLASASTVKSGYRLRFVGGSRRPTRTNPNGIAEYCYAATPVTAGQTGVRSFGVDQTGRVCFARSAANLCASGSLPEDCEPLG